MKKKKGPLILTGVLVILLIVYFGLSSWNKKQDKKEEKETVKVTDLSQRSLRSSIRWQQVKCLLKKKEIPGIIQKIRISR